MKLCDADSGQINYIKKLQEIAILKSTADITTFDYAVPD